MDKVLAKKTQIIEDVIAYIIQNGMTDIGLRKLAEVSGTSDRMLIYYFETKDALLGQVLHTIASNFTLQLDAVVGAEQQTAQELRDRILSLSDDPAFYPVIQLWFELVGLAARGQQPYAENARAIAANWLQWIEDKLVDTQKAEAISLFAEIEGKLLFKTVGLDVG